MRFNVCVCTGKEMTPATGHKESSELAVPTCHQRRAAERPLRPRGGGSIRTANTRWKRLESRFSFLAALGFKFASSFAATICLC